ncbi:GtrA family protein [Humibacter ginsenosidimutans]|uniref:GtrA family protein n=1 Tax=Humibacter ginsenosidimutans TaxID=2599293 RepID=A0A5B8MA87_9MICO|nr:GtrA family protein [Humibacter ginsenosidimutans]QDZ16410.1 GtrA family protein [Humibacter ginsenosidimutans]
MAAEAPATAPPRAARSRWSSQLLQLIKFGAVGGVGVVVNFVVFNALWLTVFNPSRMPHGPILATISATLVAIVVNWLGNRYWAFAADRQSNTTREGIEFFLASLIGMCVPLVCIGVSRYVLGFHSLLADNIANNVVGLALGTLVRYLLYKFWVYSPRRAARFAARRPAAIEAEDEALVP